MRAGVAWSHGSVVCNLGYVVFTDNEEAIATPRLLAEEEAEMALSEQIRSGILISFRVLGLTPDIISIYFCKSKYGFKKGYMP